MKPEPANHPRFVVLDRDGTIIAERCYLSSPEQVELLPHACEGLRAMRDLGLGLIVATNQSAVGRGLFDLARLDEIHRRFRELLARDRGRIGWYLRMSAHTGGRLRLPQAAAGAVAAGGGRPGLFARRVLRDRRQAV